MLYVAAIRTHEARAGGHTPIIVLIANAMQDDCERYLQAGMDDYLSKPVESEDLMAALQKWMQPLAAASFTPSRDSGR